MLGKKTIDWDQETVREQTSSLPRQIKVQDQSLRWPFVSCQLFTCPFAPGIHLRHPAFP